jgi:hypothetical protein
MSEARNGLNNVLSAPDFRQPAIRLAEGFANLVRGSQVSLEQVLEHAPNNWYVEAQEALDLGLIGGVV